ncbi:MAG TPA: hypothetical protein VNA22_10305 [Pyrinomonadaceae bacterium]|nr:hypothetical protein [Pyrinomonadaceae bacterium]
MRIARLARGWLAAYANSSSSVGSADKTIASETGSRFSNTGGAKAGFKVVTIAGAAAAADPFDATAWGAAPREKASAIASAVESGDRSSPVRSSFLS